MLKHWLDKPIPLSKEHILPVFMGIRAFRHELHGAFMIDVIKDRMREFVKLLWHEV